MGMHAMPWSTTPPRASHPAPVGVRGEGRPCCAANTVGPHMPHSRFRQPCSRSSCAVSRSGKRDQWSPLALIELVSERS